MNNFVDYINLYNIADSDHENIFDEYISQKGLDFNLDIDTKIQRYLLSVYECEDVPNIIITGNAGDGKTRLCRKVIEKYFGKLHNWDTDTYEIGKYKIIVIKDLSELNDNKIFNYLIELQDSIIDYANCNIRFLIAANEGKLTRILYKYVVELEVLREVIMDSLENKSDAPQLKVINLNDVTTHIYVKELINKICSDLYWNNCENCSNKNICTILFNRNKITHKNIQEKIELLYKLLEYQGIHITIRDMLIHMSYMLTGGLNCKDIVNVEQVKKYAYYENCFATNKSKEYGNKSWVIRNVRKFNIGEMSNYFIDDIVLNGELKNTTDSKIFNTYEEIFGDSELDMRDFSKNKNLYLSSMDDDDSFISIVLHRCRRKLYFETEMSFKLLPFNYLEIYIDTLNNSSQKLKSHVLSNLIKGLNNSITNLYLDKEDYLYLTINFRGPEQTSNPIVIKKINRENIKLIVAEDNSNYIDCDKKVIKMDITEEHTEEPTFEVDFLMFEYLMRLSYGGMQDTLKEFNWIKIKNFKERLINNASEKSILEFITLEQTGYKVVKITAEGGNIECI